jgi:hypothetical protein
MYRCTDERTTDFTLALMDFIAWDDQNSKAEADNEFPSPLSCKRGSSLSSEGDGFQGNSASSLSSAPPPSSTDCGVENREDVNLENIRGITKNVRSDNINDKTNISNDTDNRYYVWPDFILDLLNHPIEWASWRKRVERAMFHKGKDKPIQNNVKKRRLNYDVTNVDIIDNVDKALKLHEEGEITTGVLGLKVIPMTRRKAYFEAMCEDRLK